MQMFCFQHFPLGQLKASKDDSAMTYWNDERVKSSGIIEKESNKGLLHGVRHPSVQSSTSFDPDTRLTHPNCGEHMQGWFPWWDKNCLPFKTASKFRSIYDDFREDNSEIKEVEDDEEVTTFGETDLQMKEINIAENEVSEVRQKEEKGNDLELRRSNGVITPSWVIKTPWIDTKRKSKGKRKNDDNDILHELCTRRGNAEEGDQNFEEMHDYFLKRRELYCLQPRGWINNKVMSMVTKTLVADQREDIGRVSRHIFIANFMHKIVVDPRKWSLEDNEMQILLEYL
ncbi:hypothetical protein K1719_035020 [Acacia pycnantha]|nr:hypothetical protein K1719_035020 [Acacia pycnantha]